MRTPPPDLPVEHVAAELRRAWGLPVADLTYQPLGFGSHHWLVRGTDGSAWFATADDLSARLRGADDTEGRAFARLAAAFGAAYALQHRHGLDFVLGPLPAVGDFLVRRISPRYSLVVHPFVDGRPAGDEEFDDLDDRLRALDLIARLHCAGIPDVAPRDDFTVPNRHALEVLLTPDGRWSDGPYASPSRSLLSKHGADVRVLLSAYDRMVARTADRTARMVLTHGEPGAGNILRTASGLVLIDWESALVAPPERDLWSLADEDPGIVAEYTRSTGVEVDREAFALYRLWYDLAEIGGYLKLFAEPHQETADTAESWRNLEFFLRPRDRWPDLFG